MWAVEEFNTNMIKNRLKRAIHVVTGVLECNLGIKICRLEAVSGFKCTVVVSVFNGNSWIPYEESIDSYDVEMATIIALGETLHKAIPGWRKRVPWEDYKGSHEFADDHLPERVHRDL